MTERAPGFRWAEAGRGKAQPADICPRASAPCDTESRGLAPCDTESRGPAPPHLAMPNPAALRLMMPKPAASRLRLFCYANKLFLQIKFRIDRVKILAVEIILHNAKRFAKTLIMHNLPLSQEADRVENIRVIAHADDVIIGGAGFLFRSHVFGQVCDGITLRSKAKRVKREACRRLRVDPRGMIDEVGLEPRFFNLLHRHIAGQLMHDGGDHL